MREHIREKILALKVLDSSQDQSIESLAVSRVRERLATPNGSREFGIRILAELEHSLRDDNFKLSAIEILRQSIVLTWGSFEVLASDTWVNLLNRYPWLVDRLLENEQTKKWFQPRELISVNQGQQLRHLGEDGRHFGGLE